MKRFFAAIPHFFIFLWTAIFGRWSWTPPRWVQFFIGLWKKYITPKLEARRQWISKNPKKFRRGLLIGVLAVAVAVAGWQWWERQPKPVYVTISVTAPGPTPLKDDAHPDKLILLFSESAASLNLINKTVTDGVTMSPKVDGAWKWESDTLLTFTPKIDWPVGEDFSVTVAKPAIASHVHLDSSRVKFQSALFVATLDNVEYYQHPENPKEKRVVANIRFSHAVDKEDFKKRVSFELTGTKEAIGNAPKAYGALVTFDKFDGTAYVQSDVIPIPPKDCKMTMKIAKGTRSVRGGPAFDQELKGDATVPGMFTFFKFESASAQFVENDRYELDQVLILSTSTDVGEKELDKELAVYLLPEKNPANAAAKEDDAKKKKKKRPREWNAVGQVTPEILQASEKLTLTRVPSEHENTSFHTFKFTAPAGRVLYVKVDKGLKSFQEYVLAENYENLVRIPEFTKSLKILNEGSLLSLSGDKKLSVLARGIKHVKVSLARVMPDQVNNLVTQTAGRFENPDFINYQFNAENISEQFGKVVSFADADPSKPSFTAVNFDDYLKKGGQAHGLFFLTVSGWNPETKTSEGPEDKRLILLTDLGIVAKNFSNGGHEVFVAGLRSGAPVSGAVVEIMGKNGLPVVSSTSDSEGRATFPDLSDFKNEKTPVAYFVRRGADMSFLPFSWAGRELNYSRYDIGGLHTAGEKENLAGYLFSDRGIYRPSEKFHVAAIVKSWDWKTEVQGLPAEWVVTDPRGVEVYKERVTLPASGFAEITHGTQDTAPTGVYTAALYTIKDDDRDSMLGSTSLRIEEFQPDKIKISSGFNHTTDKGWVNPTDLKAWVHVQNLFGSSAEERRVTASIQLIPSMPAFRDFKDYRFFDPDHADKSFSELLEEKKTDDKGDTEFALNLEKYSKATFRLVFHADSFEAEGGRAVATESSVMVSPLPYLIGYKADGDLDYIHLNAQRSVNIIALDPSLKRLPVADLKAELLQKRYVSVLMKKEDGTFRYESVRRDVSLGEKDIAIAEKGLVYALPTDKPGDFIVSIKNKEGTELNKVEYSVVGESNLLGRLDKNAELQVKLSKADYATGEEIELHIQAPYAGAGLITIERDKVYAVKWFKTASTSSIQRIRVPAGLEGNGYVNVAFLRDIGSKEIFQSPLSYGVVPFSVARARRTNGVDIKVAHDVKPGFPLKISYKTAHPGKVLVFAIDEGVLQVAGYKTPDPLGFYFRKRALEVTTLQILDLLLPEYHLMKELSAAGGDMAEGAMGALGKNLNPFKRKGKPPVAFWSGILDSDGTMKTVTFNIPDSFNGALKIVAVAVSKDSLGAAEDRTFVKGDFIISPTIPTFVSPGDEFEAGYSVSNQAAGSGPDATVHVTVKTSEALEVVDGAARDLQIPEGREKYSTVKIRVKDGLGNGTITFTALSADKKAAENEDLSIRPSNPYRTQVWLASVKSGKKDFNVKRDLYPQFAKREVAASVLPLGLAHGLLQYLDHYPYGCTEQLISQALPYLILKGRTADFGIDTKKPDEAFKKAIDVLRSRQTGNGGFSLWDGGIFDPFASLYGIHYLVEAQDHGFAVPQDLVDRGTAYLKTFSRKTPESLLEARDAAFALYLLARLGDAMPGETNGLRSELDQKFKDWKSDLTALFLAGTYKITKQDSEANTLLSDFKVKKEDTVGDGSYFDGVAQEAFLVLIVAKHFPERLPEFSDAAVEFLADQLGGNRYNTLNSALSILALDALGHEAQAAAANQLTISEKRGGSLSAINLRHQLFARAPFSAGTEELEADNEGGTRVYLEAAVSGFDHAGPAQVENSKIEVQREYQDKDGKAITQLKVGDEADVHIRIRSLDGKDYSDVAVVDLLPAGFEVVVQHPEMGGEDEGAGGADRETDSSSRRWSRWALEDSTWEPDFMDVREDRVVVYGEARTTVKEFIYKIRAVSQGKFTIPPSFAEGMYDQTISSEAPGGTFTVASP